MPTICEQCGTEYRQIAGHWSRSSSCEHPPLSQYQREIATGLLMGDGYIDNSDKNPRIQCKMITKPYLEHVAEQFEPFSGSVRLQCTAAENTQQTRDSGFGPNAQAENYSDVYRWHSMCHPDLRPFAAWYDSGKKVWPADIELTPTVLKHWYCGDGSWHNSGTANHISIAMSNEREHTAKVDEFFERAGLPAPSNYAISKRSRGDGYRCSAQFTVEQSKQLWDYMGPPLPGFEYKWPEQYHE